CWMKSEATFARAESSTPANASAPASSHHPNRRLTSSILPWPGRGLPAAETKLRRSMVHRGALRYPFALGPRRTRPASLTRRSVSMRQPLSVAPRVAAAIAVASAAALAGGVTASAFQRGGGAGGAAITTGVEETRFHYMGPAPAGRIAAV